MGIHLHAVHPVVLQSQVAHPNVLSVILPNPHPKSVMKSRSLMTSAINVRIIIIVVLQHLPQLIHHHVPRLLFPLAKRNNVNTKNPPFAIPGNLPSKIVAKNQSALDISEIAPVPLVVSLMADFNWPLGKPPNKISPVIG
jgi:hypothetical protein